MAGKSSTKSTGGDGLPDKIDARIMIIEGRYYDDIGDELLAGAKAELKARGCTFEVITVPGALEIPQVLAQAEANEMFSALEIDDEDDDDEDEDEDEDGKDDNAGVMGTFDGAVALGCVIRGETAHYDIVCNNANHWLMETVIKLDVPFGNAILTVDTKDQAMARAKGGRNGKGGDAVRACLSVLQIARRFEAAGMARMFGVDEDFLDDLVLGDLDLSEADLRNMDLTDLGIDEESLKKLGFTKSASKPKNGNGKS